MFGVVVRNNNNQEIIYGNEVSFLFIGKMTVELKNNGSGQYNNLSTRNFGFDCSNVLIFTTWTSTNRPIDSPKWSAQAAYNGFIDGYVTCSVADLNTQYPGCTGFADFYVFAPANKIPVKGWGICLWNSSNIVAFHTVGAPLKIKGYGQNNNTGCKKTAVIPALFKLERFPLGPGWGELVFFRTSVQSQGGMNVSNRAYVGGSYGHPGTYVNNAPDTPYIDGADYD